MLVRMIETRHGRESGFRAHEYRKDETYDVQDATGRGFIERGWARTAEPGELPAARRESIAELHSDRLRLIPTNPRTYADKGEAL